MKIKPITKSELESLLKLKVNKNFKDDFTMFLPELMDKEIHFIAMEKNEILGAFSYKQSYPIGKIIINDKEYNLEKDIKYLYFIEVKPSARGKGVGKALVQYMFDICNTTESGIKISNIVLDGMNLVDTYRKISNELKVDLFFYHGNNLEPQIFNAVPVEKEKSNILKRFFTFK